MNTLTRDQTHPTVRAGVPLHAVHERLRLRRMGDGSRHQGVDGDEHDGAPCR